MKYIVYFADQESSGVILGVGGTPEDAIANTVAALGGEEACVDGDVDPETSFRTALATPALISLVESQGGRCQWSLLPDGTACAEDEFEAGV